MGEHTSWRSLFLRGLRYSLLVVMSAADLLDWKIYEGSVNSERFLEFTADECIPGRQLGYGAGQPH